MKLMMQQLIEVVKIINSSSSFLVVSHQRPDADAYGSSSAVFQALKAIGKKVTFCNESGIINRYLAIPGVSNVDLELPENLNQIDCCIICDCGALNRVGEKYEQKLKNFKNIINIDHHTSNSMFGKFNCVNEKASSTSEIVYHILNTLGVSITPEIAYCLMAGVVGDTGFFRYESVTAETFHLAEQLTKYGASAYQVTKDLFSSIPYNALKFQSAVLLESELYHNNRAVDLVVYEKQYQEYGVECEDADLLVDRIREIQGVDIACLIREDAGIWRISLRSKTTMHDVAKIAAEFGGGGHKSAAGFRWKKDLETLKIRLRGAVIVSLR